MNTSSNPCRRLIICAAFVTIIFLTAAPSAPAQPVLFDFDSTPIHTPLPIDLTVAGITAHFTDQAPGYAIQAANTMGFTPAGFAGNCIYPSSIDRVDLFIKFDQALTDFSIMYACQELACDNAETMRITAYSGGALVGTNTRVATNPGTWPSDTLMFSLLAGFDSVVIHYDSKPPTCTDYGTIFMADNMVVTPLTPTGVPNVAGRLPAEFVLDDAYPNPFNPSVTIRYQLPEAGRVTLRISNALGQSVATIVDAMQGQGPHTAVWNAADYPSGVYFYRLDAVSLRHTSFTQVKKALLLR